MKVDMPWKFNHWWQDLAAFFTAGTEVLGIFLDKNALALAQVQKTLSGIQVKNFSHFRLESGRIEDLTPDFH